MTEAKSKTHRRPWAGVVSLVPLMLLGGLVGCGDETNGGGDQPEAQPAPDVSVFAEGEFDGLPIPPRADPVGRRSEDNDVVTRSFSVRNTTVREVLQFYERELDGWTRVGEEDVGTAVHADYERDGRGLRVTVQSASDLSDEVPGLQLSLQLGPPERVFVG